MRSRKAWGAAWLVGLFVAAVGASAAERPEDAGQAAAESWLRLVDGGDYSGAWSQGAAHLKATMKQGEWSQTVGSARAPLGKHLSRRLKSREYTEKAPTTRTIAGKVYTWGKGRYVVLEYESAFAKKPSVGETVVTMADPDGVWRVSGYTVQ